MLYANRTSNDRRANNRISTVDCCFLLQLVQLCRCRSGWNQPSGVSGGGKDYPGSLLLPCQSAVYPAGLPEGSRWGDYLRLPSRRLPLQHRELLCKKENDPVIFPFGLYWCGKGKNTGGMGVCCRRYKVRGNHE